MKILIFELDFGWQIARLESSEGVFYFYAKNESRREISQKNGQNDPRRSRTDPGRTQIYPRI